MTTDELLERLKKADSETWESINFASKGLHGFDINKNPNQRIKEHIIQGEIQRAITYRDKDPKIKRRWGFDLRSMIKGTSEARVFVGSERFEAEGDSPTEAILAAYLAAIEISEVWP